MDNLSGPISDNISISHIPKFVGSLWFVSPHGSDDNSGINPDNAFLTIGKAFTTCATGDAISIAAGTYMEVGLDLSTDAVQLWFELGAILDPATGTGLVISGDYCMVRCEGGSIVISPGANQTGMAVSGNFCYIWESRMKCSSIANIGFDITGNGCVLTNCRCSGPLVAAFKIQGDRCKIDICCTGGEIADGSVGFWVTNSCDKARIRACSSQGHSAAGFQFDTGCTNIMSKDCDSGGGDGHFIDNATNTYLDISDKDSREEHESTYPIPDGKGVAGDAITVQSQVNDETGGNDTKDYFGDCALVIPVDVITEDWFYKGVNIFATSTSDEQRFHSYRIVSTVNTDRDGGNAWNAGATALTVSDASLFVVDDLVWVSTPGYKPDGEIVKITNIVGPVITIARQTEASGRLGLHWNHTINDPGNEAMYLVYRDERQYHSSDFDFSGQSGRFFLSYRFAKERRMHRNDGLVLRLINGTDGLNSTCDITAIWSD